MKRLVIIGAMLLAGVSSQAQSQCGVNILGIDTFPWSIAQPFPWSGIQGLWKVDSQPDVVFKLKVTRQTNRIKQLNVEVYSRFDCDTALMRGVGIISSGEKNVVRIILENKLMKLAMFDTRDLAINVDACGETVLAASIITPGVDFRKDSESDASNMVLKKLTNSLELYCKKRN